MIDGKIMDKIYHGGAWRYANRERKLINFKKGERCIAATSNFGKNQKAIIVCKQGN